ncbi:N,N-dimethylformamidase beta subunit family domain-containing protein [Aminobacter sp. MDW-2]|uniref:N,N-dimethylformamidase beta subunit family domain-containing protein n=1 Tax=Aminobacter sp. MDW-2 TaxID=2666139 RepID=UPI0012AF7CF1|nr:N,N-dimethylformamidase beta subunit family domain-containing protein [Aminobacter sp. MDW-2]MRX37389.1 LamG domain-containing protein [Aminobacter sp. MDW-2]QNH37873.1 LamG domain-containing protein [Aminobacter sp. MDW-2]
MAQVKVFGYADKISVKPGEVIQFHVNADGASAAEAHLVRLIHGDEHPDGPGFVEELVECAANGVWKVEKQYTQVGSFLEVADPERRLAVDGSLTLCAFIHPLLPKAGIRQCLIGRWDNYRNHGFCLGINEAGRLEFWVGRGDEVERVQAEVPLQEQMWYFVAATLDARTGQATLYQEGVGNRYNSLLGKVAPLDYRSHVSEIFRFRQKNLPETPFLMAGSRDWHEKRGHFVSQLFCGKIDRCGLFDRPLRRDELDEIRNGHRPPSQGMVAYWDTTDGYTDRGIGDVVTDIGPFHLNAKGYNRPVRAQTGWNWNGFNDCFRLAPEEYGGIEFHADALIDCNWEATKSLRLPETLRSGVYAMRLRAGNGKGLGEEHIVFFVRPKAPTGRIAFFAPTASYLAYANEHLSFDAQTIQPVTGMTPILADVDIEIYRNEEFGLSTYDHSADGQGVCYSSYRRPIVNMRPKHRISSLNVPWGLAADLSAIAWLEHMKYDYDVLTDEDLHRDGSAALAPYRCVITGTHSAYYSERMLDATEDYISAGGRFVHLGANGLDTCVAFRDDEPWVMECRRFGPSWKPWEARPGEYYMAANGEKGGAWRARARAPQKVVGTGFISDGFGTSRPYRRMPDSYHRTVSWITKGIEGEMLGDLGLVYGGAASLALDRYDLTLGTPPHTKIIASSGGHTDNYIVNPEVIHYHYQGLAGSYDYRVRADMTYFTAPKNGGVFSAGSIAFGQSLPARKFNNGISRLLANVVNAFVQPGPLPGGIWVNEEKQWK